jgi:hypothetical protein
MTTAELKTRMHIAGPDNYQYYVCYESPAGWLYNGMTCDLDAVARVKNTTLADRAKDENGLTLRQALDRLVADAVYDYIHDENGYKTGRIK